LEIFYFVFYFFFDLRFLLGVIHRQLGGIRPPDNFFKFVLIEKKKKKLAQKVGVVELQSELRRYIISSQFLFLPVTRCKVKIFFTLFFLAFIRMERYEASHVLMKPKTATTAEVSVSPYPENHFSWRRMC
jgi:hypothetical protein